MANVAVKGKYHPKGYNNSFQFYVEAEIETALAAADTLEITLPDSVDMDSLPIHVICFAPDAAGVRVVDGDLAITQHSNAGVTRLTAQGAVLAGSTVILGYTHRLSVGA